MFSLEGTKVLDFTHFIAGPYCTQILADHGAEVIKIEPTGGEPTRVANPLYDDFSIYFGAMNRNKKGIAIDLKSEKGKEIVKDLIKEADLVVTNYSVGVPEKLGIDYDTISQINPQASLIHISGFGMTGEKKHDSAFDGIIQAMSGIAHLTGSSDGPPKKAGLFIADHIAGLNGAIGSLLALQARTVTGKGQLVDIGMFDSMVSMLAYNLSLVSVFDIKPHRAGNRSTNVFATTFPSKDGHLYIAPLTEQMWVDLCDIIGYPEWSEPSSEYSTINGRLKHYDFLEEEITKWTKTKTTEELLEILNNARIASGRVNSVEDLLKDNHLYERNMILDFKKDDMTYKVPGVVVKMSDSSKNYHEPAPQLGEHTLEILQGLGYSEKNINELSNTDIIHIQKKENEHE